MYGNRQALIEITIILFFSLLLFLNGVITSRLGVNYFVISR